MLRRLPKGNFMKKTNLALVFGTIFALAGCGGGGGDSEAKALVPLSAANYDTVAQDVVDSISGTGPIFDAFDGLASHTGGGTPTSPYAALGSGQLGPISALALRQFSTQRGQRESAMAVYNYTEPCVSGSLRVTENDADNNEDISSGDSVSLVASECVFASGQPAVNGTLALRVNAIQFDRDGDVISANVGLTFTGFRVADISLNGAATVSASADVVTLAFRGLTASQGDQRMVYDYTLTARPGVLNVDGRLSVNGSTYGLSTPQPITMGYSYPNGGQLRITDGHGGSVLSTFQVDGYVNRLFLAGDNVVDATSELHRWAPV